jgi:hypothetical protein
MPKRQKAVYYIRAERNRTHKDLGRTLAGNQDEISDPDSLHFEMKTDDGVWPLWDCGSRNLADSKAVVLDFLQEGKQVFLYKKVGDGMPMRYEDHEIREAREKIPSPLPSEAPVKSPAAVAEAKRLLKKALDLKSGKKIPVHDIYHKDRPCA